MRSSQTFTDKPTGAIARTYSHDDAFRSWTHKFFIPRPIPGGLRQLAHAIVRPEGSGRIFHRQPVIVRRTRNYIVIHQSGGFDE